MEITIDFRPFGKVINICSDEKLIIEGLSKLYSNFLVYNLSKKEMHEKYEIKCYYFAGGIEYQVLFNGKYVLTAKSTDELLSSLDAEILHKKIQIKSNYWAIHAGAVLGSKGAILFVANTGSGKSTITAYLTLQGFTYLTDDLAIIDRTNLNIVACPFSIKLRKPVIEKYPFFKNLVDCNHRLLWNTEQRWIFPCYPPLDWRNKSSPINAIIFVEFDENSDNTIIRLNKLATLQRLLVNSFFIQDMELNRFMGWTLANTVPSYCLIYQDLEIARELIETLL